MSEMKKTAGRIMFSDAVFAVILVIAGVMMISPVAVTAYRSSYDGFTGYKEFFLWNPSYLRGFLNSLLISGVVTVITLIVSAFGAYVFAKVRFRGRNVLFYLYIIVMMMPFQVTLLPQYIVSREYNIYDTPLAMILPGIFMPFAVFLLTQMIKTIPDEIIEAGRMDTGSTFVIITQLIIPSVRTGLICTGVLVFAEQWNMTAEPLILIESAEKQPLSVLIGSGEMIPEMFAVTVVFMVLPMLLFVLFEEEILDGLGEYRLK